MINWVGGNRSPFLSFQEVSEIIAILGKHGMVGKQSWMTVGYGYLSDGEDADWYKPDSSFVNGEFWEQELSEIKYYDKSGFIRYPFQKFGSPQDSDVKVIKNLQKNIEEEVGEILYDYGYEILSEGVILKSFDFGYDTEPTRNDNYESNMGADWEIFIDPTKLMRIYND